VNPPFYEKGGALPDPAHPAVRLSSDAAAALGVARACLDAFIELASTKSPRNMILLRDQTMIQDMVGHAEATLRSARAFLVERSR
jgi:alkylation response protein AidB-like acyl-CoA dehydrogenase